MNPADPTPLASTKVTLTVTTQTPVLDDLSPNQGQSGQIVAVTLGGSGFDATSVAMWDDNTPVGTMLLDSSHLYVAQLALPAGSGSHPVRVRNGTSASNYVYSGSMTFTVGSAPPLVSGLSPGSAYQGDTGILLTVTGNSFPTGTSIQLQPPGGAWTALTSSSSVTSVTATTNFVGAPFAAAGAVPPAGDWLARLLYPGGATSATLPFRLLSNQAILQSASPRSAAQGTSVPVTMAVANLRGAAGVSPFAIAVEFSGGTPVTSVSVSRQTGNGTVTATISAAGLATGTYTLKVKNPGAVSSNALSFNVTPGLPHLTSLTCSAPSPACASPTSAPMQDAPVPVNIVGSNFAKPDAADNGGSAVHIFSATVTDYRIPALHNCTAALAPCALVVDAGHITAYVDTRAAVPGTYSVQVWNPGSANPPQKSPETLSFTVTAG